MSKLRFHAGESSIHDRYGIRERIDQIGPAIIRDHMPGEHRDFFAKLPLVFVGSLDSSRRPWASVLFGRPGFLHAPDRQLLRVDARAESADPLSQDLVVDAPVALLGIEPATRRRNRMNGTVTAVDDSGFTAGVEHSFGNCPKYIQARDWEWSDSPPASSPSSRIAGGALDVRAREMIETADTLFIASASADARGHGGPDGVDVSHRGGKPGFVRVTSDESGASVLTMPDFVGNYLFNTLGNLVSNPRAGLLFLDFARGDLLQLAARTRILWDGPEVHAFGGAQRVLEFVVEEGVLRPGAMPLSWSEPEQARELAKTGEWPGGT